MAFIIDNIALGKKVQESYLKTIASLAHAVEARDSFTYGHSARVASLGEELALRMGLTPGEVSKVKLAGLLHDIGKIGIPESVLKKQGELTSEEFRHMREHPEIAVRILKPIEKLFDILPLIRHHHEKLNGKGYPLGLKGEEIPIGARILAVADTYDILISERPYRENFTSQEALHILDTEFDNQVDKRILDLLKEYLKEADCPEG